MTADTNLNNDALYTYGSRERIETLLDDANDMHPEIVRGDTIKAGTFFASDREREGVVYAVCDHGACTHVPPNDRPDSTHVRAARGTNEWFVVTGYGAFVTYPAHASF